MKKVLTEINFYDTFNPNDQDLGVNQCTILLTMLIILHL